MVGQLFLGNLCTVNVFESLAGNHAHCCQGGDDCDASQVWQVVGQIIGGLKRTRVKTGAETGIVFDHVHPAHQGSQRHDWDPGWRGQAGCGVCLRHGHSKKGCVGTDRLVTVQQWSFIGRSWDLLGVFKGSFKQVIWSRGCRCLEWSWCEHNLVPNCPDIPCIW